MAKAPRTAPTSQNPSAGLPPEVAAALQERGDISPSALHQYAPATNESEALQKLAAMTAELESQQGTRLQHSEAQAAVAELTSAGDNLPSLPEPAFVPKELITDVTVGQRKKEPTVRLSMPSDRFNPNAYYVELPDAVAEFVQVHTELKDVRPADGATNSAASYYAAHAELRDLLGKLPATVVAPIGWDLTWINGHQNIDVRDILMSSVGNSVQNYQQRLTDLIRWACTSMRGVEADAARGALRNLEERGEASDKRLQDMHGNSLLNKALTIASLVQTPAFAGQPDLLAHLLLDDWQYVERGVQYRTPVSELSGTPALLDSSRMSAICLSTLGVSSFAELHSQKLINEYRISGEMRTPSWSIATGYRQKHLWVSASRLAAAAESPVIVTLGCQEQLERPSSIDQYGYEESWEDFPLLTITADADGIKQQVHPVPLFSVVAPALADTVKVLQLLNAAGK